MQRKLEKLEGSLFKLTQRRILLHKTNAPSLSRYVTDLINEPLVAVVNCEASTGEYFVGVLTKIIEQLNLEMSKCVGNSTNGASNMQGQYRGFSALLYTHSPNQVHVWCYAHVLNLVLADTTEVVLSSATLLSLLNDIAVFIQESYHQGVLSSKSPILCLSPIGEARWWAKDSSLKKVFGVFGKPNKALFVDVLLTLTTIQNKENIKPTACVKATGHRDALLKHETVLTAQLFLREFEETASLSKYLQTNGMDLLSAHRMVVKTEEKLKSMARDFESVKIAANTFVHWANEKLQELEDDAELEVEATLPQKRLRKKIRMPGELAEDEIITKELTKLMSIT